MNDVRPQLAEDMRERRPKTNQLPDDARLPGRLRHTTPRERAHRERGMAYDSPGWRESLQKNTD
jgi:hypothetical protein